MQHIEAATLAGNTIIINYCCDATLILGKKFPVLVLVLDTVACTVKYHSKLSKNSARNLGLNSCGRL